MTDTAQTPATEQTPSFNLTRCYLKDASLELPNAPQIFLEQASPDTDLNLNVERQDLGGGFHEVTVQITMTTKVGEKVLFLVEAKQAGIFQLTAVPEEDTPPLLEIAAAGMVYGHLRPNVADLVSRAGLPPVYLTDVDFRAFYEARLEAVAEAASATKQ